ncbi:hypothetical protein DID76_03185 [Candidatus Marinamargulisbacteria bacterium SCGC AG-414-C22]|nr:hypothetical protein DID76_03185 [Candidatus Marinamargulisbacteria bacterium SCGC AG-414-C22]
MMFCKIKTFFIGLFIFCLPFFVGINYANFSAWEAFFSDEELVFSNFPESIDRPGLVFDKTMEKKRFRVFYHHHNVGTEHMNIVMLLSNPSKDYVSVNVIKGLGGSSKDVVFAGHKAVNTFFQNILDKGDLYTLPPKSTVPIVMHKIKSNQISSGVVRIDRFSDHDVNVKMMVTDLKYDHLSGFVDVPNLVSQFRVTRYDESIRYIFEKFDVADHIKAVKIGGSPYIKDIHTSYELKGNYGLLYGVFFTLSNPTNAVNTINFFLSPVQKNSVDRASFLIDGELKEVGNLNFKNNVVVMEHFHDVELAPFETKTIYMLTMPQAGCYYPVDIILKTNEV